MVRRRDDSPERMLMIGDRYERIQKLGEGTYGKVYKARDTESGDIVALKKCRIQVRPCVWFAMRDADWQQDVRGCNFLTPAPPPSDSILTSV